MNSIIEFLSGQVPGGIILFLLIVLIVNLTLFFFFKGSKFFTKSVYLNKVTRSNGSLVLIYLTLWIILKPNPVPQSVIIMPFQNKEVAQYFVSETIEQLCQNRLSDDHRIHEWEWFYQTCNKDSINDIEYRISIAERLKIDYVIFGKHVNNGIVDVSIKNKNVIENKQFNYKSYIDLSKQILLWANKNLSLLEYSNNLDFQKSDLYIQEYTLAKKSFIDKDFKKSYQIIKNIDPEPVMLKSKLYLEFGKKENSEKNKTTIEIQSSENFNKIKNLLLPIARENNDDAILNKIMGNLFLYEEKYKEAEIFLKKAITQNPNDSRIYNSLYYLHEDRFYDLGFENKFEVLKKAIILDNGYAEAIYNLANEYFQTGTGIKSGTGTTSAIEIIEKFLKINNSNKKILNLYASINLQIKHPEKAAEVYKKLIELGNPEGIVYYNLGIAYFHMKKYELAEQSFMKSIELDDYPDSYLYIGAINKIIGNYDKALYYYRERIKRSKKGEDDYYAKEALHGLQWILKHQSENKK